MKEHLRQLAAGAPDNLASSLLVREYLQARTLESFQDGGVFLIWAFVGGTALRFLYGLPRFSEDLDFSLGTPQAEPGFGKAMAGVKRLFTHEGYRVEVRVKEDRVVASAWLVFPGLPHELGLSARPSQNISIRVELDTKPPAGAALETSIVRRHVTLNLCHHDRASLLAGKLHAVLTRPWTKGRDLFDLAWYLGDRSWPPPNLALLNAALAQTGWSGPILTSANWAEELRRRLGSLDWKRAQDDVRPFLEKPRDVSLVSAEAMGKLLEGMAEGKRNT